MMTNAGLLIKDSTECWSPHAESSSVSPEPDTAGAQLIVSIVWTALDSRYLPALHSSLHTSHTPSLKVSLAFARHRGSKVGRGTLITLPTG